MNAQNPIAPEGTFLSDPQARVWDGKLYVYGSRDDNTNQWCSYELDALSTSDLKNWTRHEAILGSRGKNDNIKTTDSFLWAPDCIFQNGKYHLFYCTPDRNHTIGVAVGTSPSGPFKEGHHVTGPTQIDPTIIKEKDGYWIFWGQANLKGARLKKDLSGIDSTTLKDNIINRKEHFFHEGAQIFKRNGIYYLTYADEGRKTEPSCIGYSTSKSLLGPYKYQGVIIDNRGCDPTNWNNHGSVFEYKNNWYIVYHRASNGQKVYRKACIEPITFDSNGLIKEVEMTSNGASPLLDPFRETPARLACKLGGNARVLTTPSGHEILSTVHRGDSAIYRYFNFTKEAAKLHMRVTPKAGGTISVKVGNIEVAKIEIPARRGSIGWTKDWQLNTKTPIGRQPVTFYFDGKKEGDLFDIDAFWFE